MSVDPLDLTVIVLTYNEELHIARALDAIAPLRCPVVVVDSFSTDRTAEIAESRGAIVMKNKFVNQAKQFQWALDNAPLTTAWLMRLDADEIIEADLIAEIERELPRLGADVVGVNLKRKHVFMDRWVRHGGRFPLFLLRIWRRGKARVEDRWMDEHILVWGGRTVTFDGGFADHNLNDLTFFVDKHNKYATREAIEIIGHRRSLFPDRSNPSWETGPPEAKAKRFVKERIYNQLPFQVTALGYFAYRYLFQLGFLDGKEGLIYHGLQAFWYRFLVGAKLVELERAVEHLSDPAEIRAELARLTGLRL
jgi:glycosyltransferase involved in cell wall biosynthesis